MDYHDENNNVQNRPIGSAQKEQKPVTIIPLTIKMLQKICEAADDTLYVDETRVEMVSLCARVTNVEEKEIRIIMDLNDNTDTIQVVVYKTNE
jgi:hypothetical protein